MEDDELLELLVGLHRALGEAGLGSVVTAAREESRFDDEQVEVVGESRDAPDAARVVDEIDRITRSLIAAAYSVMLTEQGLDEKLERLNREHGFPRQIVFAPEGRDVVDTPPDSAALNVMPLMATSIGGGQPLWTSQRVDALRDAVLDLRKAAQLSLPPAGGVISAAGLVMWASGDDQ